MTYLAKAKSRGNPDYGQRAPVSPPREVEGATVREVVDGLTAYRDEWLLGGGNWTNPAVTRTDGTPVGYVSYNGRMWNPQHSDEVDIDTAH